MQGLPGISHKLVLPIIAFFFVGCLCACSDSSDSEANVLRALDEGLVNSNLRINNSTEHIAASLNKKLMDPTTNMKAQIWYPKAMVIQQISKEILTYIEGIKAQVRKEAGTNTKGRDVVRQVFISNGKANELYAHLSQYRRNILSIDSGMSIAFENAIRLTSVSFDSAGSKEKFPAHFFGKTSVVAALAMLTLLQNNVKNTENMMVQFCDNKISFPNDIIDIYFPLVSQSSSIVKGGEQIEIIAGIGAFSLANKPEVRIDNRYIPLNSEGISNYKFKAANKPGNYIIPVKIVYTDEEGRQQNVEKNIQYTVAEKCDQTEKIPGND